MKGEAQRELIAALITQTEVDVGRVAVDRTKVEGAARGLVVGLRLVLVVVAVKLKFERPGAGWRLPLQPTKQGAWAAKPGVGGGNTTSPQVPVGRVSNFELNSENGFFKLPCAPR